MKKTIVFKLTDKFGQTRRMTQWGNNVSHTAKGNSKKLCSNGFIHYYTHPLLAVLMNPVHADFKSPKLWEAEASGKIINEALKSGCKTLRTIKEIPLPEVSGVQKIAFGILCAKEVCKGKAWNKWADKWLSGEDRSKESADAARSAAYSAANVAHAAYAANAANAANAASYAATRAANAAAARAANAAADAADAANDAAYSAAAANAATANKSINFIALAEKSMTYK